MIPPEQTFGFRRISFQKSKNFQKTGSHWYELIFSCCPAVLPAPDSSLIRSLFCPHRLLFERSNASFSLSLFAGRKSKVCLQDIQIRLLDASFPFSFQLALHLLHFRHFGFCFIFSCLNSCLGPLCCCWIIWIIGALNDRQAP